MRIERSVTELLEKGLAMKIDSLARCGQRALLIGALSAVAVLWVPRDAFAELPTGPDGVSGTYGEASGRGIVDESNGAMTYSIPFDLPAARGNAQPALVLHYRSNSGTGEAGEDWSLTLPVIERAPLSNWPKYIDNGNKALEDRYTYSGEVLVFVCTVGGILSCPAEAGPMPAWANGHRHYRLRVDRAGERFFLNSSRQRWLVQLRGGQIMEFGEPLTQASVAAAAVDREPTAANKIFRWNLARHYDLHGIETAASSGSLGLAKNVVVYRWTQSTTARNVLTDIFYTPPAATPTNATLSEFAYHVQLDWEQSNNPPTFARMDKQHPWQRLRRVAIAAAPWRQTGAREIVRQYHFTYYSSRFLTGDAPLWHRSFLRQVEIEGRCGGVEANNLVPATTCPRLPAQEFEYESASIAVGTVVETDVSNSPAGGLPYPANTTMVDIDRDGRPDIIQGWPQNRQIEESPVFSAAAWYNACKPNDTSSGRVGVWVHVVENGPGQPRVLLCPFTDAPQVLGPARRQDAYLNRGQQANGTLTLQHHCLDADALAAVQAPPSPPDFRGGSPVALFSQFGSQVLGPWGDAVLLWSKANKRGFAIDPTNADPAFCPSASSDAQYPALKWRLTDDSWWAKSPSVGSLQGGTYVDIDGDGYIDRLGAASGTGGVFGRAGIAFTRRLSEFEATESTQGPALVPFVSNLSAIPVGYEDAALGPPAESWYADVNGDGLVDLISVSANPQALPETRLEIRPGNGRGHFGCAPAAGCLLTASSNEVSWLGNAYAASIDVALPFLVHAWGYPPYEDPIGPHPTLFVHDVTGDGLADLIVIHFALGPNGAQTPRVRLWVNIDGHRFLCAHPANDCVVGTFSGTAPINSPLGLNVLFADVDGNGIDDLVILGETRLWHFSFLTVPPVPVSGGHRAPRPGLLTHVRNGVGADTDIVYQTVQELDLEASTNPPNSFDNFVRPWTTHVPTVVPVVTRVSVRDTATALGSPLQEPFRVARETRFAYRDPAYDVWTRSFKGFRRVRTTRSNGETIQRWHWFTACESGSLENGEQGQPSCADTSDKAADAAFVGLLVRLDRFFPGSGAERPTQWLSTKTFRYTIEPDPLINSTQVWRRADLDRLDEYLYDTTAEISRADTLSAPNTNQRAPEQPFRRVRLVTSMSYNTEGSRTATAHCGRTNDAGDCGSLIDPEITQLGLPTTASGTWCRSDWRCQPTGVEIRERRKSSSGEPVTTILRQHRFEYGPDPNGTDFNGDLINLYSQLLYPGLGGLPHYTSRDLTHGVGFPPSASTLVGERLVMTIRRDAFGTPTRVLGAQGPQQPCVSYGLDPLFAQFNTTVTAYTGASCTGPTLEQEFAFDRGLGQVTTILNQQRRTLETLEYDAFGRFHKRFAPHPDAPYATLLALQIDHFLQSPMPHAIIKRPLYEPDADPGSLVSIEIFNGIGEHVLGFDQADITAYGAPWILRDWTERNNDGDIIAVNRPFLFGGDPYTVAVTAPTLTPLGTQITALRDVFGRPHTTSDNGHIVAHYRYLPLQIETRDAEQAKASGPYAGNFSRSMLDGHGHPILSQRQDGSSTVTQTVDSWGTGEPLRICRHSIPTGASPPPLASACDAPDAYARTFQWDSFGRLVQNDEPNTSRVVGTERVGWVYAYDNSGRLVAITDARGCGRNIYHDALGRRLAEDYSPCDANQPAYTVPDLTTGDGTEAFYRYDQYEPAQAHPTSDYADREEWAAGTLVSIQDRGSHTRLSYDARGRLRRTSRQVVKPGIANATVADRYAPHWFTEMLSYDDSDRVRKRTTTLRTPELLVNGESADTFAYVGFQTNRLGSSYGSIAENFRYLPNHALTAMTYGDAASTQATFDYDDRDRLSRYHLFRHAAPSVWSMPGSQYSLPGSDTTELDLSLNYVTYDDVGNPTSITDENTSTWPTGTRSVSRNIQYDSAYRVTSVQTIHGGDAHVPAYLAEGLAGDRRPVAVRQASQRPTLQTFQYDWQGNTTLTDDAEGLPYDRSLGSITNGRPGLGGPNQLIDAVGIHADYDSAGNLTELTLARTNCWDKMPKCTHRFVYDWNEIGQLVRARRWDYSEGPVSPLLTNEVPTWDLAYAYTGGMRVLTTALDDAGISKHTLDVFGSLRLSQAAYDSMTSDYVVQAENEVRFVAGMARVFSDPNRIMPNARTDGLPIHVFLALGDHLGSTSFIIDKDSGEVVERSTYQPFGAIESDMRPSRWASSREAFKFTGKEEDIEVGLTYFGARYYQAQLGRWASADPLTIHGLAGDINPYAYVRGRVMSHVDPLGLDDVEEVVIHGKPREKPEKDQAAQRGAPPASGSAAVTKAMRMTTAVLQMATPGPVKALQALTKKKKEGPKPEARVSDLAAGIYDAVAGMSLFVPYLEPPRDTWVYEIGRGNVEGGIAILGVGGGSLRGGPLTRGGSLRGGPVGGRNITYLPGGTGRAIAAHGTRGPTEGTFVVPEGSPVSYWTLDGHAILDETGRLIEQGNYATIAADPILTADVEGAFTALPGSDAFEVLVSPPRGLTVMRNSMTVYRPTPLSEIVGPNMGVVDCAFCLESR
jgi:RHS repeat-associated protein